MKNLYQRLSQKTESNINNEVIENSRNINRDEILRENPDSMAFNFIKKNNNDILRIQCLDFKNLII